MPNVMVIFVQTTFVLVTFVHIRNISALEQIPTVTLTFAQPTFVLAAFAHIRNISALTDPILMKL